LKISSSSILSGDLRAISLFDSNIIFSTINQKLSWVEISFENTGMEILVKNYRIKHGFLDNNDHVLRTWRLEGSLNGSDWYLIKQHLHDHSISKQFSQNKRSYTFNVENNYSYYNRFRIVLTGRNSFSSFQLVMSSIEFYGYVIFNKSVVE
jgi:hypothetical protein